MYEFELLQADLPDPRYQADMKLYEFGQRVFAELLKLSLAGIGVIGFLLPLLFKDVTSSIRGDRGFKLLFVFSIVCFAASTATVLFQRFCASSSMFHHINALKLSSLNKNASLDNAINKELLFRKRKFLRAHGLLQATAILLAVGAALMGAAFIRLMFVL